MEFVSGPTLADRIAEGGALDWRKAARICAQVADALTAAHDSGLVPDRIWGSPGYLAPGQLVR